MVEPKNLECPIGTPVSSLLDACGGLKDGTYKLIAGGPMMGMAQYTADISVAKGTGAIGTEKFFGVTLANEKACRYLLYRPGRYAAL